MRKDICIQTIFRTKTIQHRKNWFRDPYLATRGIDLHDFYIYQNKRGNVIESVVISQLHDLITIRRKSGDCIPSLLIRKRSMCNKIPTKNKTHN